MSRKSNRESSSTVGLCWLIEHFRLSVAIPVTHSQIAPQSVGVVVVGDGAPQLQPRQYLPNGWLSHLRFALLHEPIPLDVYRALLQAVNKGELTEWVRSRPKSTAARRAWYLYELLLGDRLEVPDIHTPTYVDLLSPVLHVTGPTRKIQRHRIYNNLLGCEGFSPLVRRTARLNELLDKNLAKRADALAKSCTPAVLAGTVQSLFVKFLDSTGKPDAGLQNEDVERFVSMVMRSDGVEITNEEALLRLHNLVVGPQGTEKGWRTADFPTKSGSGNDENISIVFASAADIECLMTCWMEFVREAEEVEISEPLVMAAVAACAFMIIRPFADGNRRMQSVILHHLLSVLRFTSPATLCPVSAVTLKNPCGYVDALEHVSLGTHKAVDWYRYFDATACVEYVMASVEDLISVDLPDSIQLFKAFGSAFRSLPETIAN